MASISPIGKPPDGLLVKLATFVIERSAKNYVTTIVGVLVGVAGAIPAFMGVIPPKYQAPAAGAAALCGAIALALAKDK